MNTHSLETNHALDFYVSDPSTSSSSSFSNLSPEQSHPPQVFIHLPPQALPERKTLFLDLDETLIKVSQKVRLGKHDFSFSVYSSRYFVYKRKHLDEFLRQASKLFELVIYTAATEDYCLEIINQLDPKREFFSYVLTRKHCIPMPNGGFLKRLSNIQGREPRNMLLVDDNEEQTTENSDQSIPILPLTLGELEEDTELEGLLILLKDLSEAQDVRQLIRELKMTALTEPH